jgi:hypothetical protein
MPDAALYGGDSGSSTDLSTSGSCVAQDQTEIDQLGKMGSAGGGTTDKRMFQEEYVETNE